MTSRSDPDARPARGVGDRSLMPPDTTDTSPHDWQPWTRDSHDGYDGPPTYQCARCGTQVCAHVELDAAGHPVAVLRGVFWPNSPASHLTDALYDPATDPCAP